VHDSVLTWVGRVVRDHQLAELDTLELGAYNVNGTVRDLFTGNYFGVDMVDGPGVDRVMSAHDVGRKLKAGAYQVVVSTEMLEHDPAPWLTMAACKKVLAPGGHLIVTARGNGFKLHNEPDYWRFLPTSLELLLDLAGCDVVQVVDDPQVPGVFAHGTRRDT
jgi:SAM-dependent methyltransferase